MSFDPAKPVQTRDGRKARVICTDYQSRYPLVVLVEEGEGERLETRPIGGYIDYGQAGCDPRDLVNVEPTEGKA